MFPISDRSIRVPISIFIYVDAGYGMSTRRVAAIDACAALLSQGKKQNKKKQKEKLL